MSFPVCFNTINIAITNVMTYDIVCEYTNQYILKLLCGKSPDHSKKLQINIIRIRSSTESILSVLKRSRAAMFERTYKINDNKTWLNPTTPSSFNCSPFYPIASHIRKIIMKYPILKNIFA